VSKKRAGENRVYASLKNHILETRIYCEMPSRTGAPSCLNRATQIHHMKGRTGPLLCDVTWWLAVCQDCHTYIEDHKKEMRTRKVILY
jgi:hypothetical protein